MRAWEFDRFELESLRLVERPDPQPSAGQIVLDVRALSLNYRDLLVISGGYNPRLKLPATPLSDAAGVVAAVGEGVSRVKPGDAVATHFVSEWIDGPFRAAYTASTLGTPGPGLAAERVALAAEAVVPLPPNLTFEQAATLPIAALTAWSALVTEGRVEAGQTVLTLGTGGVSIFALQLARALGARVIVTSSSDEKLARAAQLGADAGVNRRAEPRWDKRVLELTDGRGADVVVETGGVGTLTQSLNAVRAGGVVAMLGALTGLQGEVNLANVLMKRVRVAGILVDSRRAFEDMLRFIEQQRIEPVISDRFAFDALPDALRHMRAGGHFGKIVLTR